MFPIDKRQLKIERRKLHPFDRCKKLLDRYLTKTRFRISCIKNPDRSVFSILNEEPQSPFLRILPIPKFVTIDRTDLIASSPNLSLKPAFLSAPRHHPHFCQRTVNTGKSQLTHLTKQRNPFLLLKLSIRHRALRESPFRFRLRSRKSDDQHKEKKKTKALQSALIGNQGR